MSSEQPWEPLAADEVAGLLTGAVATWWLSGGCALDRFLGRVSRPHGDVDVSVRREDWPALRAHLAPVLELFAATGGELRPIGPGPAAPGPDLHNVWARARGGGPWRLQVNLEEAAGAWWVYRRDPRVRRPMAEAVLPIDGLPCVAPAVQLLWKAKAPTGKDELDYRNVVPRLVPGELAWLARAVRTAHPDSPWAGRPELG